MATGVSVGGAVGVGGRGSGDPPASFAVLTGGDEVGAGGVGVVVGVGVGLGLA